MKQLRGRQRALSDLDIAAPPIASWARPAACGRWCADIEKVARTDANVLITGENGTGKELVARAIHRQSLRNEQPFVGVDLGAITETLFESELFGHRKGAFTDAREDRAGRFEAATGGTLFLDEIGNLSLAMQAKLLGALETMTVTRVGSDRPVQRGRARDLRHQSFARAAARSGAIPAGPALPHQHHRDPHSAAARAHRGHPAADRALRAALRAEVRTPAAGHPRRGAGTAAASTAGRAMCASSSTRSSAP